MFYLSHVASSVHPGGGGGGGCQQLELCIANAFEIQINNLGCNLISYVGRSVHTSVIHV